MNLVECRCGQSFLAVAGEVRCSRCEETRDALTCAECGTRLLRTVPKGLCGLCDESWEVAA